MPVPATDLPAPIAVLVLAWDEATPAVRALVEAAQAPALPVDSILVMVPQADAPDHLSAEEYLPLSLPEVEMPASTPPAPPPAAAPLPPATSEPAPPVAVEAAVAAVAEEALAAPTGGLPVGQQLASPSPAPATEPAPLAWLAVRILRLGSQSLPQLAQRAGQPLPAPIWTATSALPAAPYLGAAPLAGHQPVLIPSTPTTPAPLAARPSLAITPAMPDAWPQPVAAALSAPLPITGPGQPASPLPLSEATEPRPQAADLEADFLVAEAAQIILEAASPGPVAANEPAPALPAEPGGWPEALAALRQPAALTALTPVAPAPPLAPKAAAAATHPALRPAPAHYPAPDLNFQIIQYARFAVPVALAEPEFTVIYAPAWPTWLAAQELRYRTGRPLVLHVAELAATARETVETATGWIAELQRQALHRADLILTETPALAQRLRHELGLAAGLVQAIPAADTAAIAQALHTARVRPMG